MTEGIDFRTQPRRGWRSREPIMFTLSRILSWLASKQVGGYRHHGSWSRWRCWWSGEGSFNWGMPAESGPSLWRAAPMMRTWKGISFRGACDLVYHSSEDEHLKVILLFLRKLIFQTSLNSVHECRQQAGDLRLKPCCSVIALTPSSQSIILNGPKFHLLIVLCRVKTDKPISRFWIEGVVA